MGLSAKIYIDDTSWHFAFIQHVSETNKCAFVGIGGYSGIIVSGFADLRKGLNNVRQ